MTASLQSMRLDDSSGARGVAGEGSAQHRDVLDHQIERSRTAAASSLFLEGQPQTTVIDRPVHRNRRPARSTKRRAVLADLEAAPLDAAAPLPQLEAVPEPEPLERAQAA